MFYKIRIIETLEKEFEIEAKNEKEALEKIQIAYDNEEIMLYPENLDHGFESISWTHFSRDGYVIFSFAKSSNS
ncbi:hypothetical protein G7639_002300 [Enterococcus faecalis]|nr:hypothetical protein [Enterococcus faecalis]